MNVWTAKSFLGGTLWAIAVDTVAHPFHLTSGMLTIVSVISATGTAIVVAAFQSRRRGRFEEMISSEQALAVFAVKRIEELEEENGELKGEVGELKVRLELSVVPPRRVDRPLHAGRGSEEAS